jgi:hypothetical protein
VILEKLASWLLPPQMSVRVYAPDEVSGMAGISAKWVSGMTGIAVRYRSEWVSGIDRNTQPEDETTE